VYDQSGAIVAVLEVMNCSDDSDNFSEKNVQLLETLCRQVGKSVSRCLKLAEEKEKMEEEMKNEKERCKELVRLELMERNTIKALNEEVELLKKEREAVSERSEVG